MFNQQGGGAKLMSKQFTEPDGDPVPKICRSCRFLDDDWDERAEQPVWSCQKNVWFPTRKGTCQKHQRWG